MNDLNLIREIYTSYDTRLCFKPWKPPAKIDKLTSDSKIRTTLRANVWIWSIYMCDFKAFAAKNMEIPFNISVWQRKLEKPPPLLTRIKWWLACLWEMSREIYMIFGYPDKHIQYYNHIDRWQVMVSICLTFITEHVHKIATKLTSLNLQDQTSFGTVSSCVLYDNLQPSYS